MSLLKVNGADVENMNLEELAPLMRGDMGTTVEITLSSVNQEEPIVVELGHSLAKAVSSYFTYRTSHPKRIFMSQLLNSWQTDTHVRIPRYI